MTHNTNGPYSQATLPDICLRNILIKPQLNSDGTWETDTYKFQHLIIFQGHITCVLDGSLMAKRCFEMNDIIEKITRHLGGSNDGDPKE